MLTNKQYKNISKISRYSTFPIYYNTEDELYQGGITNWLSDKTIYIDHTIEPNDTLDSLALYYYQNPVYYWIIADFNRITDVFQELEVGSVIKIPTFSNISWEE